MDPRLESASVASDPRVSNPLVSNPRAIGHVRSMRLRDTSSIVLRRARLSSPVPISIRSTVRFAPKFPNSTRQPDPTRPLASFPKGRDGRTAQAVGTYRPSENRAGSSRSPRLASEPWETFEVRAPWGQRASDERDPDELQTRALFHPEMSSTGASVGNSTPRPNRSNATPRQGQRTPPFDEFRSSRLGLHS
jgi:hypothetical protein